MRMLVTEWWASVVSEWLCGTWKDNAASLVITMYNIYLNNFWHALFDSFHSSFRMTFPTVWQISVRKPSRQRRIAVLLIVVSLFLIFTYLAHETLSQHHEKDAVFREYARKYEHIEVTNTDDENLYYGIVIDMGSSGSRVFVYFWPQHTGKSNELLHIQQMRDQERNPVVKKIKPGINNL